MALRLVHSIETGIDTQRFPEISRLVSVASGQPVAPNKSIVGDSVFTHEAGIHVDGLLKDVRTYQGLDPLEVGRTHRIVLGKHSGAAAIVQAYAHFGITLDDRQASDILACVRRHAVATKHAPGVADLKRFYLDTVTCATALPQ